MMFSSSSTYPDIINLIDLGPSLTSSDPQTDDVLHLFDPLMLDDKKCDDGHSKSSNNKSSNNSTTISLPRPQSNKSTVISLDNHRARRIRDITASSTTDSIGCRKLYPSISVNQSEVVKKSSVNTFSRHLSISANSNQPHASKDQPCSSTLSFDPIKLTSTSSSPTNTPTAASSVPCQPAPSSPSSTSPPPFPAFSCSSTISNTNSAIAFPSSTLSHCSFRVASRAHRSRPELFIFAEKLQEKRSQFKYSDKITNPGFVISPRLDFHPQESHSIKLEIFTSFSEEPIILASNINASVEHIIFQVVCSVLEDTSNVDFHDYSLKVDCLNEYLVPGSLLREYAFIHHCQMFDRDVRLILVNTVNDNDFSLYIRTAEDDANIMSHSPDDLLPTSHLNKFSGVNKDAVNMLLETLDNEIEKFILSVNNESSTRCLSSVIQATKALISLLGNCDTLQLTQAIENLSQKSLVYDEYQKKGLEKLNKQQLDSIHGNLFNHALTKLKQSIQEVICLYCEAFPVDFDYSKKLDEVKDDSKNQIASTTSILVSPSVSSSSAFTEPVRTTHEKRNSSEPPKLFSSLSDTLLVYIGTVNSLAFDWQMKYREFFISCEIRFGEILIAQSRTGRVPVSKGLFHRILFNDLLHFESLSLSSLPREAKLFVNLIGIEFPNLTGNNGDQITNGRETSKLVALTVLKLFDYQEKLIQGSLLLGMWSGDIVNSLEKACFVTSCTEKGCPLVVINLPDHGYEITFPEINCGAITTSESILSTSPSTLDYLSRPDMHPARLDSATIKSIHLILNSEPVQKMSKTDTRMLWDLRNYLHQVSYALPKVLKCAPSWKWSSLEDIYATLNSWRPLPAVDAMQLLSAPFPDKVVRSTAVQWISRASDDDICDYLPQLIQALRFEPYLDSPLIWFLLEKAYSNVRIAHNLYWLLKQNLDPIFSYRSRIYLNALLLTCGSSLKRIFENQESLQVKLSSVSERLKNAKDSHRLSTLLRDLVSVNEFIKSHPVALPLSPSMQIVGVDIESCSYFNSNTLPLKLVFKSHPKDTASSSQIEAIYKVGDDLRQDAFTMQMIKIMNKLWLQEGLDLRIVVYDCMATDHRRGFVEMVKNAETLRKIQNEYGITGTFRDSCISEWLQKHNPLELDYRKAVENFTLSLAGYLVVTYVLGIGDRHNDNIMITTSGHLFHIDFGKYLGDAQMLGSIKRDRTPFILTSDMAYVINGGDKPSEQFQNFVVLCCDAFNTIRRHTNLFLNLFSLMVSSDVPGLSLDAVKYIHSTLLPSLTEAEATIAFNKMIEETLSSVSTKFNFFLHNLAQLRFTGDSRRKRNKRKASKKALQRSKSDDFLLDYMDLLVQKPKESQQ
ncbi:phosphatidylinositol-4-phosphate 3-kinase catalytic subunit Pi3K68D [Brevipalpus obovatus]|uniref:phosphatidylinositol-4-phosphate 3-kinase catalytic subunit Pi3K68D n=1 Tax=Brevipalpus obovatus TaxID=246614 RepID=UPI003D9FA1F7